MAMLFAQASGTEVLVKCLVLLHLALPILGGLVAGIDRHNRAARRAYGRRRHR